MANIQYYDVILKPVVKQIIRKNERRDSNGN